MQNEFNYDLPTVMKPSDNETPAENIKPSHFSRLYIKSVESMTFAQFIEKVNAYIDSQ